MFNQGLSIVYNVHDFPIPETTILLLARPSKWLLLSHFLLAPLYTFIHYVTFGYVTLHYFTHHFLWNR